MITGEKFEEDFAVTGDIYRGFISLFRDQNPLHTNTEFAKSKGFPEMVMHGNILGGFISYFIGECLPLQNVIIHSQEIQYLKPVFLDQALLLKAEVQDVFDSVNAVQLKFSFVRKADSVAVARGKIQIGII